MPYYYTKLANCEADIEVLTDMIASCERYSSTAQTISADLHSLGADTGNEILLQDPGSVSTQTTQMGTKLLDAIDGIKSACSAVRSTRQEQAEWYREENRKEDRRREAQRREAERRRQQQSQG